MIHPYRKDYNVWKDLKKIARSYFLRQGDSKELFDACWQQYRSWVRGAIDDPKNIDEVMEWLNQIASEKVNNPKSRFYIHG